MKQIFRLALLLCAASVMGVSTMAQETDSNPGLSVGSEAPKFTLQDSKGESIALQPLLEKGPVALVFFRSADW